MNIEESPTFEIQEMLAVVPRANYGLSFPMTLKTFNDADESFHFCYLEIALTIHGFCG